MKFGRKATDHIWILLCALAVIGSFPTVNTQVSYDVNCSSKLMKVVLTLNDSSAIAYLDKLKGYPECQPEIKKNGNVVFRLPLDNIYTCGTARLLNKLTGHEIYYHRIIVESRNHSKEVVLVKCSLPGDLNRTRFRYSRITRDVLPDNFTEPEYLNITDYVEARAPIPYLNAVIRQNGRVIDTTLNLLPGTPLEMVIFLDENSKGTYGLLASYLKVTSTSQRQQEEIIVMNGCSIDPYIFGNFQTGDSGDTIIAPFRAFKFPESNYVLFVGTVNVCLKECKGVPCGNGQFGYGRKKREIPAEMPYDPNKIYEVEITTFLKVEYKDDQFTLQKGSLAGQFSTEKLVPTVVTEAPKHPEANHLALTSRGNGHLGFHLHVLLLCVTLCLVMVKCRH